MSDRDAILDRIRKCMALSKSANEHEAAAALRQAQKLMEIHQLTAADVALSDVKELSVKAVMNRVTAWEAHLARLVADAFGCELIVGRQYEGLRWVLIGVAPHQEVAAYALEVLLRQCGTQRAAYVRRQPRSCKQATKVARGDAFAMGWAAGVEAAVQRLALGARDEALLAEYMAKTYPQLTSSKVVDRSKGVNLEHWARGLTAGRDAKLNHAMPGKAAQPLLGNG